MKKINDLEHTIGVILCNLLILLKFHFNDPSVSDLF